ncbi:hypothetical protein GIB67_032527 [Kingdonia uniflora]|uniref:Uncharacterized protein n=1 Tax=Kingdonia uniflora TaxID=39325 RepID=A0A7J7L7S3_9MAGN|nr:hypothetical protein GIB67_032527 [Kingdonia uniflora]
MNLAKASASVKLRGRSHRRGRSRKKGVMEVDGDDDIAEIDNDSSDAESVKERSGIEFWYFLALRVVELWAWNTLNGTCWWSSLICSKEFKDKSTQKCRRRWYTYLNADFERGGWSLEEDKLLCEAQKRYGNRWTEIVKVVSCRTDNAVKNHFTTLLKKEAKREALSKENINLGNNLNNKQDLAANGSAESLPLLKKMKTGLH